MQLGEFDLSKRYIDSNAYHSGNALGQVLGTMIVNAVSSSDQEAKIMEQYADELYNRLYPAAPTK